MVNNRILFLLLLLLPLPAVIGGATLGTGAVIAGGGRRKGMESASSARGSDVTYDGRSLIIGGQRKILFSGSIHYPRSTPEMWPSLIAKAKDGGLDVIDTYVFWNLHEPHPGQYDFSGGRDTVRFIKLVRAQGLYVCLRIGPFIEAEWSYGGLPFWLHDIPGIVYRSDNKPFKAHMKNFTTKIVKMMQSEKLYAPQGGPIILSQIENEYGLVEGNFGEKGPPYVKWAAKMATGLKTGVPWVMRRQDDAPDPVHRRRSRVQRKINGGRSELQLSCLSNSKISNILFASYGTPLGTCGINYSLGMCHAHNSKAIAEKACLGKTSCSIPMSSRRFGGDPCPAKLKSLLVVAECK